MREKNYSIKNITEKLTREEMGFIRQRVKTGYLVRVENTDNHIYFLIISPQRVFARLSWFSKINLAINIQLNIIRK